ncbi:hypothetical protein [Vreelandella hamiltonii]|uniref:Uncharacterized protein n=1 Tax=Halomonas johnsoniae TaxID=502832 RepID=A0ABQ2WK52_9GAMM|nr:hypothetical protein [Halomonas johnsoniae]GGW60607.1 hypothetical protein GCM10007158_21980 [Halomonas johnsoniae]
MRQHLYKGTQPGSREHLEKYLMDQKRSRAKVKEPDKLVIATSAFFLGCAMTLLAMMTF